MLLGSNFLPVHDFEISVDEYEWEASSESVECPTIFGDIENDHPISGRVYMLVHHQDIHCPRPENHLMCLMQI